MQTDDLAAQMVREMGLDSWFIQDEIERCEAIARRYIEKALTAQAEEIERLRGELRRIAEGNLGDAPWQANYEKMGIIYLTPETG